MSSLNSMVRRNRQLFFSDKGMLISSMITPIILIVLYAAFLSNVYKESFASALPDMIVISDKLINGTVAAQLSSALLAVSCVTVTFCVNLTMVMDRSNGSRKDFDIAPVRKPVIYLAYLVSTILNSLMVNFLALFLCLLYIYMNGWYMSGGDIFLLMIDMVIMVLFGSVLSGLVCYPLKTHGQKSAVQTVVSAGYGFVCGAYMPTSSFSEGLQKALGYFPGTYGTSLLKNHMLRGVFAAMEAEGFPKEVTEEIAKSLDLRPVFNGHPVTAPQMMLVMIVSVLILGGLYLLLTALPEKE